MSGIEFRAGRAELFLALTVTENLLMGAFRNGAGVIKP